MYLSFEGRATKWIWTWFVSVVGQNCLCWQCVALFIRKLWDMCNEYFVVWVLREWNLMWMLLNCVWSDFVHNVSPSKSVKKFAVHFRIDWHGANSPKSWRNTYEYTRILVSLSSGCAWIVSAVRCSWPSIDNHRSLCTRVCDVWCVLVIFGSIVATCGRGNVVVVVVNRIIAVECHQYQ